MHDRRAVITALIMSSTKGSHLEGVMPPLIARPRASPDVRIWIARYGRFRDLLMKAFTCVSTCADRLNIRRICTIGSYQ